MTSQLRGILPALVTPFEESGSVHVRSLEKLLERVYQAGADGVYVCGSTGEGLALPARARQLVAEIALKHSPPGKQIIAHIGAATLEETIALTKHASSVGVTAISSLPLAGMRPQDLADFYGAVAHHASVPLVAYYFPAFTGSELSIDQLERICRIPGVTGVKFTDYDLYKLSLLAARNIAVFNGRDEVLAAGLLMGASGGIGSIYNVVPHRFVELFRMASSGQWENARTLQRRINQLITVLLSFPLLPAIKQVLGWRGIECGRTLKCPHELTPEQKEALARELQPLEDLLAA